MSLIIKNQCLPEEYYLLQALKNEIEESVPEQSYIRVVYSGPHGLEIQVTSQSLCWEVSLAEDSVEELVKRARNLLRTRIKQWHIERNLS